MNDANIVIMGKTGSGKSTLVNAIIESDVAPTGAGQPITMENQVYTRSMLLKPVGKDKQRQINRTIKLYDTVGLEIDNRVTQKTLNEIKAYIEKSQSSSVDRAINLVWFCVNNKSNRFEPYEVELIKELANSYEIPFVIIITQCFSEEKGDLEKQIERDLPEISTKRILAKDYKTRVGIFPSFGIDELLSHSVFNYDVLKVTILESKLDKLTEALYVNKVEIEKMKKKGKDIITDYSNKATKIGWIPALCIPFVHGLCIKMICELTNAFNIKTAMGFEEDIFANVIIGLIATPLMVVPLLSAAVAGSYVETVGEQYMKVIMNVIAHSTLDEIKNDELMAERIKKELLNKR